MTFEQLQKTWQSQPFQPRAEREIDVLLTEIQRNQKTFEGMINRRDWLEVIACAGMTMGFGAWGYLWDWWSLYVLAFACLMVGMFFIVDRRRQHRRFSQTNTDLRSTVQTSLAQVKHQIWLLKNIFWWYLLPVLTGLSMVIGQIVWSHRAEGGGEMLTLGATLTAVYAFTYGFVYWANQRAVRKQLDPRRKELELLLQGLE